MYQKCLAGDPCMPLEPDAPSMVVAILLQSPAATCYHGPRRRFAAMETGADLLPQHLTRAVMGGQPFVLVLLRWGVDFVWCVRAWS